MGWLARSGRVGRLARSGGALWRWIRANGVTRLATSAPRGRMERDNVLVVGASSWQLDARRDVATAEGTRHPAPTPPCAQLPCWELTTHGERLAILCLIRAPQARIKL